MKQISFISNDGYPLVVWKVFESRLNTESKLKKTNLFPTASMKVRVRVREMPWLKKGARHYNVVGQCN